MEIALRAAVGMLRVFENYSVEPLVVRDCSGGFSFGFPSAVQHQRYHWGLVSFSDWWSRVGKFISSCQASEELQPD